MGFYTPQVEDSPTYPGQAILDACDLTALASADASTGWCWGFGITATGSTMVLTIGAGVGMHQGNRIYNAGGTVTPAVGGTYDRRDAITLTSAGALAVVQGTYCTTANWVATSTGNPPVKPAIPSTSILLYEIYVPAGATALSSTSVAPPAGNIADKRLSTTPSSFYNVLSYGATGNGTTDDSTAITAAATAANAAGGGEVYFPPGTYRIASVISVQANNLWRGVEQGSILKIDNGGITMSTSSVLDGFYITNTASQTSGTNNGALIYSGSQTDVTLRNLSFNVQGYGRPIYLNSNVGSLVEGIDISETAVVSQATAQGIFAYADTDLVLRSVYINGLQASGTSITMQGIMVNGCTNVIIDGCIIRNCVTGTAVGGGAIILYNSTRVAVDNCICTGNTGIDGITIENACVDVSITGGSYSYNATNASLANGDGIDIFGAQNVMIAGVNVIGNGSSGIEIFAQTGTNTTHVSVVGCTVASNALNGFQIIGTNYLMISDCDIYLNGGGGINFSYVSTYTPANFTVTGNLIYNNQCTATSQMAGIYMSASTLDFVIANNIIFDNQGTPTQYRGIDIQNTVNSGLVVNNILYGNTNSQINNATATTETSLAVITRGNQGYNPVGTGLPGGQPAVPGSTSVLNNPTGCDCMVYITGGTVTAVKIGGTATGLTSGGFWLPADGNISITYSAAPTWEWLGA